MPEETETSVQSNSNLNGHTVIQRIVLILQIISSGMHENENRILLREKETIGGLLMKSFVSWKCDLIGKNKVNVVLKWVTNDNNNGQKYAYHLFLSLA